MHVKLSFFESFTTHKLGMHCMIFWRHCFQIYKIVART
jgi:hypothetical protein